MADTRTPVATRSGRSVWYNPHAVERFHERAMPDAPLTAAEAAFRTFLASGTISARPPHWLRYSSSRNHDQRYLACPELPDCCAIIVHNIVLTVLTRGLVNERTRNHRRALDRERRNGDRRHRDRRNASHCGPRNGRGRLAPPPEPLND